MNIIDNFYAVLNSFNFPVYIQGTMGEDEPYPNDFLTYWITDSQGNTYYDNAANTTDWSVNVIFYTNNIEKIKTVIPQLVKSLEENGFLINGKGQMIASDEETHIGWIVEALYAEKNEK